MAIITLRLPRRLVHYDSSSNSQISFIDINTAGYGDARLLNPGSRPAPSHHDYDYDIMFASESDSFDLVSGQTTPTRPPRRVCPYVASSLTTPRLTRSANRPRSANIMMPSETTSQSWDLRNPGTLLKSGTCTSSQRICNGTLRQLPSRLAQRVASSTHKPLLFVFA